MPSIVQINVSRTVAPAPIVLQKTGALISQGATTLGAGADALLTEEADLTPLLAAPLPLLSLVWAGGVVTATTVAPIQGLLAGDTFLVQVAGSNPAGYNGTFPATVTGASAFTYAMAVNPGAETAPGTYTPPSQAELISMVATFFGQSASQAVYVLELGPTNAAAGVAVLSAFIVATPGFFYSYLVPRLWDGNAAFLALINQNNALSAKTYFFVTTTIGTYGAYSPLMKSVFALIEAPGIPASEFSLATAFQHSLAYAPSNTNRMTPMAFAYLFGVTPYPTKGNQALLTALEAANINVVGTGAEGGITNTILSWGTNLDGSDFTFWYSADWIQLFSQQAIANTIINGSNTALNPLYYDQRGIDRLQDKILQTVKNAITFGLATGTVARSALDGPAFSSALDDGDFDDQDVVNAVPFIPYVTANPDDFPIGRYAGLSVVYIPNRGFKKIVFNITVTDFIAQ